MRELIFAILLALAGAAVTVGAALIVTPAGWIVGGVLLAAWSWLVLSDAA